MGGASSLKSVLRVFVLILALTVIWLYLDFSSEDQLLLSDEGTEVAQDETIGNQHDEESMVAEMPEEGLLTLMGSKASDIKKQFGEPERIDPTLQGYEWWIYPNGNHEYIQVGIWEGKVISIFATGEEVDVTPFKIGQPSGEIYSSLYAETNIEIEFEGSVYRFELSEADMNMRPIIRIGDYYALLYLDKFTGTLSSVRFLNDESFVMLRPYELVYRGELFVVNDIEEEEEAAINRGMEQQIIDITNVMRERYNVNELSLDEKTQEVAYNHSVDMYESEAFSHTSDGYGELSDRLKAGEVAYLSAGENIAANYVDAPSVMEGWLNSSAHRETLLNEQFTHIGVGVHKKHFTQNFIEKWEQE